MQHFPARLQKNDFIVFILDLVRVGRIIGVGMAQMSAVNDDKKKIDAMNMAFQPLVRSQREVPNPDPVVLEHQVCADPLGRRSAHRLLLSIPSVNKLIRKSRNFSRIAFVDYNMMLHKIPRKTNLLPTLSRAALLAAAVLGIWAVLLTGCATQPAFSQGSNEITQGAIQPVKTPSGREVATFAGGCFWARDAMFRHLKGVDKVVSGFAGGRTPHPSYEQVCTGTTGQAETVQIIFDPKVISYHDLLEVFFHTHDPTTLNRQAPDEGTQYRSAVFYHTAKQKAETEAVIGEITKAHLYEGAVVTQVVPYTGFWKAENYHQNYFALNPDDSYCQTIVAPEVAHFRKLYHAWLK